MNEDRLLEYYERIADAPDAIARLRRFILDLAVRGKLVPQDPSDEPALELLKRIAAEKARLVKMRELGKEKLLPAVDKDADFDIPPTWCWTRLGIVTSYIQRGKSPKYAASDGALVVSQRCIQWRGLDLTVAKQVTLGSLTDYEEIRFLRDGDLLWNSTGTGTIGRIIRLVYPPKNLVCDSHVTVVRCLEIDPEYIRTWLRSDHVYALIEDRAAGSTNQVELTAQMAINQVVPLPPLAEQHRIVAKVDELMALCDRLEAARTAREATRDRLAAASLARLNTPNAETFQDDARFALETLPALTTRPDQIKALRQTILNLAVRGKLVPQDPSDEPASELLKRIAKEKAKSTGRNKLLPEIEDAEKPFDAPSSWHWVRLGNVFSIRTGFAFKSSTYADKGTLVFRVTNFDRTGAFDLSDVVFFPTEKIDAKMSGFLMEPGEIIMVMVGGTIGKTTIVDDSILPALLNQNMWRIRSFGGVMTSKFEYLLIKNINQSIQGLTQSTHGHFAMSDYEKRIFPLPPLAEQHRIAAKVDALMALCDRLEMSLTAGEATRRRLLDALLAEALAPAEQHRLEMAG